MMNAGMNIVVFLAAWLLAATAMAQDYPNATLKIVVPFAAGGGVDVVARIITPGLTEELGQSVIIENRGGAGGMLGAAAVAQAPPDGYTLLFGTGSTHGTNSSVYSRLAYDPVKDFVPIVLVSSSPLLLVVPPSLPAKSAGELIALARSRAGELTFASYGTGSINHLGAELFNAMANIAANHIPYRGSAPALTDLIGRAHPLYVRRGVDLARLYRGRQRPRTRGRGSAPHAGAAAGADHCGNRASRLRYDGLVRLVRSRRHIAAGR